MILVNHIFVKITHENFKHKFVRTQLVNVTHYSNTLFENDWFLV